MKRVRYCFASRKLLKAQAVDLQRQLQEAWDKVALLRSINETVAQEREYMRDQLHRVARERDEERRLRLEAEGRLAPEDEMRRKTLKAMYDSYVENEAEYMQGGCDAKDNPNTAHGKEKRTEELDC